MASVTSTSTSTVTTSTSIVPAPSCGDGHIDPGEVCDGDVLGGACGDGVDPAESGGGILRCSPDCRTFDRRDCFRCGDGVMNGAREACDGLDFDGKTCATFGYGGDATHTLHCPTTCNQIITDDCFKCGNGRTDPGELCDGGACAPAQTSGCNGAADFYCDATCQTRCGDSVLQAAEECDDGNRSDGDGCDSNCLVEWTTGGGCIAGTGGCSTSDSGASPSIDRCGASWGIGGFSSIPISDYRVVATCRKGDPCDFTPGAADCTFRYYACFNRAQGGSPVSCRPAPAGIAQIGANDGTLIAALHAALGGALDDGVLTLAPALAVSRCIEAEVVVPPGEEQTVVVDAWSGGDVPLLDHDELDFICTTNCNDNGTLDPGEECD